MRSSESFAGWRPAEIRDERTKTIRGTISYGFEIQRTVLESGSVFNADKEKALLTAAEKIAHSQLEFMNLFIGNQRTK